MKATDLLRAMMEISSAEALRLIDDMQDAPLTFPTVNGGSHPLWVLGHQAVSESRIVCTIMHGEVSPLHDWYGIYGNGSIPVADATVYPSFDETRAAYVAVHAHTLHVLAELTDADLDRPCPGCPPGREALFGSFGLALRQIAVHFTYHAGQVACARRMLGRGPVKK